MKSETLGCLVNPKAETALPIGSGSVAEERNGPLGALSPSG